EQVLQRPGLVAGHGEAGQVVPLEIDRAVSQHGLQGGQSLQWRRQHRQRAPYDHYPTVPGVPRLTTASTIAPAVPTAGLATHPARSAGSATASTASAATRSSLAFAGAGVVRIRSCVNTCCISSCARCLPNRFDSSASTRSEPHERPRLARIRSASTVSPWTRS